MRELKFRAWTNFLDKWEMEYFTLDSLYWRGEGTGDYNFPKNVEVMQYTGLTDKNGKDIYEGDIVKYGGSYDWDYVDGERRMYTIYKNGVVRFLSGRFVIGKDLPLWNYNYDGEVIGNIYEYPDLLKETV